jgi:SAM-dependent methyltransferase
MINPSSAVFRPDFAKRQRSLGDERPPERITAHYLLERKLSQRLRDAPREARSQVYTEVYAALFASLPDHPQRTRPMAATRVEAQLQRIARELGSQSAFLEIGCGDAALAFAAAAKVNAAYGVDVTDALIDHQSAPPNFRFIRTSGINIPLPDDAIDFAYSDQLMEHLHPDDASDQLQEIRRVLRPGGRYMCITPSRVTGPHDISSYFDYEATGLHLKEYDYGELRSLFAAAGFREFRCRNWVHGHEVNFSYPVLRALERCLLLLPGRLRDRLTHLGPLETILGLNVIATKGLCRCFR